MTMLSFVCLMNGLEAMESASCVHELLIVLQVLCILAESLSSAYGSECAPFERPARSGREPDLVHYLNRIVAALRWFEVRGVDTRERHVTDKRQTTYNIQDIQHTHKDQRGDGVEQ